jgi:branched-chain amino acid transport system permease protein
MLPLEIDKTDDRDVIVRERFDKLRREFLKSIVTPEVVEEHRRSPLGQHSERLERLLIYFRQRPLEGRYAIKVVEPFKDYRIVALSGHRGVAPRIVEDTVYPSAQDAYHGLFMHCIRDLLES